MANALTVQSIRLTRRTAAAARATAMPTSKPFTPQGRHVAPVPGPFPGSVRAVHPGVGAERADRAAGPGHRGPDRTTTQETRTAKLGPRTEVADEFGPQELPASIFLRWPIRAEIHQIRVATLKTL